MKQVLTAILLFLCFFFGLKTQASGQVGYEYFLGDKTEVHKAFVSVYETGNYFDTSLYASYETDNNLFLKTEVVKCKNRLCVGAGPGFQNNEVGIRGSVVYKIW